jgi:hypothetical protein
MISTVAPAPSPPERRHHPKGGLPGPLEGDLIVGELWREAGLRPERFAVILGFGFRSPSESNLTQPHIGHSAYRPASPRP